MAPLTCYVCFGRVRETKNGGYWTCDRCKAVCCDQCCRLNVECNCRGHKTFPNYIPDGNTSYASE